MIQVETSCKGSSERLLIFVAKNDLSMVVGGNSYEELKKSERGGCVEIVENLGEEHCFCLFNLKYEKAVDFD